MALPLRDNAPTYDVPIANLSLITACCLVWGFQLLYPGGVEASLNVVGEIPARILAGEPIPGTHISSWFNTLTAIFGHASWEHIIGNMYALWLFGDNVEWVLGHWRYVGFYLLCGLISSLVTVLIGSSSTLPGIGASGAIAGVMGAYLIMYPRARITSIMWIDPLSYMHFATGDWGLVTRNISAKWYMGSWIVFQVVFSVFAISAGLLLNLGIYAHAAGAVAGLLLINPLALKDRIPAPDHPSRSDPDTPMIIGEAGDAGAGSQPAYTLGEELQRLRFFGNASHLPEAEFHDYTAEDLIGRGLLEEAELHCRDMLQIANKDSDRHRAKGYEEMIRQIRGRKQEIIDRRKEELLGQSSAGVPPPQKSYQQKLEETKARLRRQTPDWL